MIYVFGIFLCVISWLAGRDYGYQTGWYARAQAQRDYEKAKQEIDQERAKSNSEC